MEGTLNANVAPVPAISVDGKIISQQEGLSIGTDTIADLLKTYL